MLQIHQLISAQKSISNKAYEILWEDGVKRISTLMIMLGILGSLQAQVPTNDQQTSNQVSQASNPDNQFNDVSAKNRVGQQFELMLSLGVNYSDAGAGLTGGYYFNPNSILELELFSSEDDSRDDVNNDYKYSNVNFRQTTDAVSANWKYFTGNSFYIRPGIFYVDYQYKTEGYIFGNSDISRKDLGVSFGIGNQWQWENFTIGCEWIGLQAGMLNLSRSGRDNTLFSDIDGRGTDRDWKSASLLKLNIGASF